MEIGADRAPEATALEARRPVVPEAVRDASERLGVGIQQGAPGVVLEPGKLPGGAGLELTLQEHVADHPRRARDGLVAEEARTRHERAVAAAIPASEELVPATDREEGRSLGDRLTDRRALLRQVGRDQRLLAILAASDVEEIVTADLQWLPHSDRLDDELVTA